MVPGIGVAILIGASIFIGVSALLGDSKVTKEKIAKEIKERKLQLVIKNMQEAIVQIIEKIKNLEYDAQKADANREAIEVLKTRLTNLRKALNSKNLK